MSRLGISTGSSPNDGQGDPLRVAMGKINSNFTEIYNTFGDGNNITGYANTAGISTLARNLTGSPRINVSGILNSGITTTEHIEVRNITSTGVITATQFVGDGSQLSNVTALVGGLEVLDDNVRKGIARELNFGANIISTGPDGVGRVTISVSTTTQAPLAEYANIAGVSTYSLISGISTLAQGLTGTPNLNVGVVTATSFVGDGSGLSGVAFTGTASTITTTNISNWNTAYSWGNHAAQGYLTNVNITAGANIDVVESSEGNFIITSTASGSVGSAGTWSVNISGIHTTKNVGIGTTISSSALTVEGNGRFSGVVTATRFESTSSGTPTIDSPNNLNINAVTVAISTNLTVGGQVSVGDNNELQLFHSGVDSYIDNDSAGNLIIRDGGTGIQLRRSGGGPSAGLMAAFNNNAGVELYYDSVLKLQTFQNGVAINDSVGIGSTAGNPPYRLTISGVGATVTSGLVNAIADLTSSVDGYGQVNIRNSRSAPNASGDLVITADTGTDSSNYIDLGINNTGFSTSSWTINGALDGYLYSSDSNLSVGVAETNKYFSIFAGGTLIENEKVRVTESGVGIGTTNATSKLTVRGGDISVGINTSHGVILTSPNGSKYRLVVDNSGNLTTVLVP